MITKSKTFWVRDLELEKIKKGVELDAYLNDEKISYYPNKITISWQEEPKITISESEFDDLVKGLEFYQYENNHVCVNKVKQKLFNKGE